MCEALKELMRPEIEAEVNSAVASAVANAVANAITVTTEKARKDRETELINKWRAQGKSEEEIKALLR